MRIILIGNYALDKQESMRRFTLMLDQGFKAKGIETEIWNPIVFFAKWFKVSTSGIGKWFGYVDKWLLFPIILRLRLLKKSNKFNDVKFHISDHSNSPYLKPLPKDRTGITCHDVLAIRGAFGYADAYCPASRMGKFLQKWILKNLSKSKHLAAVSNFTLNQLEDLSKPYSNEEKNWTVIHNAFNAPFEPMPKGIYEPLLIEMEFDLAEPFILHVGSALVRKNRKQLLYMVSSLGNKWQGNICFAGKRIDDELDKIIKQLGLEHRVISIVRPSHQHLIALYSACEAFVFPSLSEGFGWPLIEAQACGAPVIASSFDPMPEVSGGAALHVNPEDADGFAMAFLELQEPKKRAEVIKSGFENIKRFEVEKMINDYLILHKIEIK